MSRLTDESAIEKCERLMAAIEAGVADENDPIAKSDALVAKALADADQTPDLSLIPVRHIREFAKTIGIEAGSPDSYAQLKKKATKRDVEKFLSTPVPAKTLGAGATLAMSKERIEAMAKARGFSTVGEDWKRGL
jgi:hypothetical protein